MNHSVLVIVYHKEITIQNENLTNRVCLFVCMYACFECSLLGPAEHIGRCGRRRPGLW